MKRLIPLIILLILAFIFWLELFVLKHFNFWYEMIIASGFQAIAGIILNYKFNSGLIRQQWTIQGKYILIGIISAVLLYVIFYIGNISSKALFNFAEKQVGGIYSNKTLLDRSTIVPLLIIIAAAEEIFWRGFVQQVL